MTTTIKNLIFDFGGVLVDLNKERALQAFAALGVDVRGHIHEYVQGGPFALLEQGAVAEAEFLDLLRALCPNASKPSDDDLTCAWNSMLVRIPVRRLQALKQLRSRYRIFLLSNTNTIHWRHASQNLFTVQGLRVEDYFDSIYLSCDLKLMKPGSAIFREVLSREHIQASETLFIDDSAANCAAAKELGIQTFCPAEADDWLPLFIS